MCDEQPAEIPHEHSVRRRRADEHRSHAGNVSPKPHRDPGNPTGTPGNPTELPGNHRWMTTAGTISPAHPHSESTACLVPSADMRRSAETVPPAVRTSPTLGAGRRRQPLRRRVPSRRPESYHRPAERAWEEVERAESGAETGSRRHKPRPAKSDVRTLWVVLEMCGDYSSQRQY